MRIKILLMPFVLIVSLLTAPCLLAQTAADELADLLDKMQTLQANFIQVVNDNSGHTIQRSQGRLSIQRPGKFSWQTSQPNKQVIIANNRKLWIYDADLEQVTVQSLSKAIGVTPALFLSSTNNHLEQDYRVSRLKDASWFKLIPKQQKEGLQSLFLKFESGQLQEMRFIDNLGHTTTLRFQKIRFNAPINSAEFILNVPKNVDVIEQE
jgi:outer membrane lipoprotein carrier protein